MGRAGLSPFFEMTDKPNAQAIYQATQLYIARAQTDAPNYRPASENENRCATCRFFDGQRCADYDFAADPEYICDSFDMRDPQIEYRALTEFPGVYKAQQHTSAVVVLFVPPSIASEIAVPGGEEPEE